MVRQWTALTGKGTPKPTPRIAQISSPVTVDEDHHIIRMSTQHWARPFATGQGEGFRDSVAPGQLRVVNPDESSPATPRPSTQRSDTAGSFLKKQRTALTAVLLNANRSRANSRTNVLSSGTPEIPIDPALSRECIIAPTTPTPIYKSYASVVTLPVIVQQPPDDPFITPPLETATTAAEQKSKRPGLAPLQSAAGAAGRTLSHIGNFLNPFRTHSNAAESVRTFSRHSVSTYASRSSWRGTAFSDPFDLDRPSVRSSAVPCRTESEVEKGRTPSQNVYEGT
ncbi:hypothetical protein LTR08_000684 [Meristemomyces frigidus]|nr:hypothetical protein LTR08_000684 [Meristemomyces frigidus]